MPTMYSNPYHDHPPVLDQEHQTSESLGIRLREGILSAFFYHPKKTVLFIIAACLAGIALCVAPWLLALPLAASISMAVVGGLFTLITTLFLVINTHVFGYPNTKQAAEYTTCEREAIYYQEELMGHATLEYQGDDPLNASKKIPYLTIEAEDNHKSGYIQGIKLASQADELLSKLKRIYSVVRLARVLGYQMPEWGSETMTDRFKQSIPPHLKEEMAGMVLGHNEWAAKNGRPLIDFNDLMMLQMLPDIHNIKGLSLTAELLSSGCTAGVARLDNGHVVHFRNTDWASHNEASAKTLFIERHIGEQRVTRSLSFPLLIGTLYGENQDGLTMSINVSPGGTVYNKEGILTCLLYRELLTTCDSVDAVKARIEQADSQPIGACQLTVSDEQTGSIIRFYQAATPVEELNEEKRKKWDIDPSHSFQHDISDLSDEHPVQVVANDGLEMGNQGLERGNFHDSYQRISNVMRSLQSDATPLSSDNCVARLSAALSTPLVNNCESVHTIIHESRKGQSTFVATDNGYSARLPVTCIDGLGSPRRHKDAFFATNHHGKLSNQLLNDINGIALQS